MDYARNMAQVVRSSESASARNGSVGQRLEFSKIAKRSCIGVDVKKNQRQRVVTRACSVLCLDVYVSVSLAPCRKTAPM